MQISYLEHKKLASQKRKAVVKNIETKADSLQLKSKMTRLHNKSVLGEMKLFVIYHFWSSPILQILQTPNVPLTVSQLSL